MAVLTIGGDRLCAIRDGKAANFAVLLSRVPGAARFSAASHLRKYLNKNTNPANPELA
ncbi:MAG TPA: hypothetical protein VFL53_01970 [Pseudolabrys sp.]|nr:hypothetical protein [Pseudolabrys sp.]